MFNYAEQLSTDFHTAAIEEMRRFASEAHTFPLLNHDAMPFQILRPVRRKLQAQGYRAKMRRVPYEFQKGGNRLLPIAREAASSTSAPQVPPATHPQGRFRPSTLLRVRA